MEIYYFWFFLFVVAAYFIITDDSVAKMVHYGTKFLKFQYEKIKWWIFNNPKNPVVKYFMWRRSMKLAKELQKYFDKNK